MTFKRTITLFLTLLFLSSLIESNVHGQARVTGHITAEVIEPVHAVSLMITGFKLKNRTGNENTDQPFEIINSEIFNMGAITINSGESMACNIQLRPATLSDNKGNCFTIEPTTLTSGNPNTKRADGSQTLNLSGTARMARGLSSGQYEGLYTLVVVYN